MSEHGQRCRTNDRRGARVSEPFEIQISRDGDVHIEHHGRKVCTIRGSRADELRAAFAVGDDTRIEQIVARSTGNHIRTDGR
ncbi:hypothetical protein BH11MYX2_BH11MYX2_38090 [soil metagenome]